MLDHAIALFYDKSAIDKYVTKHLYMKHCNVIKYNDQGQLMAFDMDPGELTVRVLGCDDIYSFFNHWRFVDHSVAASLVKLPDVTSTAMYRFKYASCVQIAKDLLGIQCFALTPEQLFNRLRCWSVAHEVR